MPAPTRAAAAAGTQPIADNRKARHNYHVFDTYEAGIVLLGTEVKAIREGRVNLKDSYGKMVERGFTLVPVRMYFKRGLVKVTVGVAKGKKTYDKRETIKRRQIDCETRAMVKERSR